MTICLLYDCDFAICIFYKISFLHFTWFLSINLIYVIHCYCILLSNGKFPQPKKLVPLVVVISTRMFVSSTCLPSMLIRDLTQLLLCYMLFCKTVTHCFPWTFIFPQNLPGIFSQLVSCTPDRHLDRPFISFS